MSGAPKIDPWVFDLVMGLMRYEDTHSKEAGCLSSVLELVPDEVKRSVRVMEEAEPVIKRAALHTAAKDIERFSQIGAAPRNQTSDTDWDWYVTSGLACEGGSDIYAHIAAWLRDRADGN